MFGLSNMLMFITFGLTIFLSVVFVTNFNTSVGILCQRKASFYSLACQPESRPTPSKTQDISNSPLYGSSAESISRMNTNS